MSSPSSVLPSDLVSVEVAAQQVGAHPQTSLTRCTFPVLYPVPAPERGPRWQTHAQRRNLGTSVRRPHSPGARFRCFIRCLHRKGAPNGKPTPDAETWAGFWVRFVNLEVVRERPGG